MSRMPTIDEPLQRYINEGKMWCMESESGVRHMEKVMKAVCGYDDNWGGTMRNFFADNSGAIEAVIEWIGKQRNGDWADNLETLVGPEEEVEDDGN